AEAGSWLAPLTALGVVVLGILPALPGIGEHGAVVAYFLYDLRWWWALLLLAAAVARADRLIGAPLGSLARAIARSSPALRLLLLDAALFIAVVSWAVTTTAIRFDHGLSGDE